MNEFKVVGHIIQVGKSNREGSLWRVYVAPRGEDDQTILLYLMGAHPPKVGACVEVTGYIRSGDGLAADMLRAEIQTVQIFVPKTKKTKKDKIQQTAEKKTQ